MEVKLLIVYIYFRFGGRLYGSYQVRISLNHTIISCRLTHFCISFRLMGVPLSVQMKLFVDNISVHLADPFRQEAKCM